MEVELWVIWSVEHNAYWKPESRGYTEDIAEAGRYITEQAIKICAGANMVVGYPEDRIPDEVMCPAPEELKAWEEEG